MADVTLSKRQQIWLELLRRVERITPENGFATDAGATVFLNETPDLGPDDPVNAVAIVSQPDEVTWQGGKLLVRWPIEAVALAKAVVNGSWAQAWMEAEAVSADLKRALELDDRTFGRLLVNRGLERGSTRVIARDPGGTTVGAAVRYELVFEEIWGNP